jgi:hypothetical protein
MDGSTDANKLTAHSRKNSTKENPKKKKKGKKPRQEKKNIEEIAGKRDVCNTSELWSPAEKITTIAPSASEELLRAEKHSEEL